MKTLRRLSTASALTLALSLAVLAGEITTMVTAPPPPAQEVKADREISTGVTGQTETDSSEATAIDSAAGVALNLIQSVLSLF